jgi:hypothetical protein
MLAVSGISYPIANKFVDRRDRFIYTDARMTRQRHQ